MKPIAPVHRLILAVLITFTSYLLFHRSHRLKGEVVDNVILRTRPHSESTAGSSRLSGGTVSVPENIVHCDKAALVCNDGKYQSPAIISSELAAAVVNKAFAVEILISEESSGEADTRCGQAGCIQCPNLPTEDSTPPLQKKQRLLASYGSVESPPPAIKVSESATRVSAVPVTALHNVMNDYIGERYFKVAGQAVMLKPPIDGGKAGAFVESFDKGVHDVA